MTSGGSTTIDTPPVAGEAAARLCPGCGYDLRAATTDRCSECGLVLDRAALQESGFPWAHRRRIGRVRAFVRTVWRVTWDSRSLRHEMAKPQDARDAARFRRWNAVAVAAALVAFVGLLLASEKLDGLIIRPADGFSQPFHPGYVQDLAVPWSAGVTLLPTMPLCLAALAVYAAGAARAVFRTTRFPAEHQARARAIASYAAAPLAWLLPTAVLVYATFGVHKEESWRHLPGPILPALFLAVVAVPALILLALGMTAWRTGQWAARAGHAGAGTAVIAGVEMVGRLLLAAVALLGVVPWCVGFLRIVADSV